MKKITTLFITLILAGTAMAGGINTNTNQSAKFTRMMWRDATFGIDAVYYNPAGISLMPNDGFYLSLNNQSIWQNKMVTSNYMFLSAHPDAQYEGKIVAPMFPGIYAAYKTGKWGFAIGFNPIGGGGGAEFKDGLPSFEYGIADLVPMLQSSLAPVDAAIKAASGTDPFFRNISGYTYDVDFSGTSVYFGYQFNVSYAISEQVAAAVGGRYVTAKNTYDGYIKDIKIDAPAAYGGSQTPGNYLRLVAGTPGLPPEIVALLNGTAAVLDVKTADMYVDVDQTGSGFTPILSLDYKPNDKWNFSVKYEFQTDIELTTNVNDGKNGGGMFEDGKKTRGDLPAQLVMGVTWKPTKKLLLSSGYHLFFDKNADYGRTKTAMGEDGQPVSVPVSNSSLLNNSIEFGLGLNYSIIEDMDVSFGWIGANTGVMKEAYQTDLSYSLSSNTFGIGVGYRFGPKYELNIGASYTSYKEGSKTFGHTLGEQTIPITETYDKDTFVFGIGLDINFGAKKKQN